MRRSTLSNWISQGENPVELIPEKRKMEHYKSKTNDYFHFSNPHDDDDDDDGDNSSSSWTQTQTTQHDDDDDGSYCYEFHDSPNLQNCRLMDSMDAPNISHKEPSTLNKWGLISNIDRTMQKLSVNLLYAIDGLSARISQLDGKTLQLDNAVDDLTDSAEYHHRIVNGKLKQLHDILQEVQDGVQFLRDKHEIAETQLQLAKLGAKRGQGSGIQTDYVHQVSLSTSQQSHDLRHAAEAQIPVQLPQNQSLPSPLVSCYQPVWQTPDTPSQQYPFLSPMQSEPPRQIYNPAAQPPKLSPVHYSLPGVVTYSNHPFLGHCFEEKACMPSYSYPLSTRHFPSHPAGWVPSREFNVGSVQQIHGQPQGIPQTPKVDNYAEMHPYNNVTSLSDNSTLKVLPFSSILSEAGSGGNNTQLPRAQILSHALPLASSIDTLVDSGENSYSVPVDDIIEKVTAMGFRRDLVKASVRKLSENQQSMDLNMVLDKVMSG